MNQVKTCVIISGGDVAEKIFIPEKALIICADCGYRHALAQNIQPDIIVGDFDSYQGELPENSKIICLPTEKDVSDTWYAVQYAHEQGYSKFEIYGTFGGERIDHTIANLQLLHAMVEKNLEFVLYYKNQVLLAIKNNAYQISNQEYQQFSVFALSEICYDVSISGAKYLLHHVKLTNSFPWGLSNECIATDFPIVSVKEGILLLVLTRK
ncbi:MAG: thiamine diphosphokinase [Ruminococcus sp.]|nr:thiamine diphosphokinase [Ruminococcus sp.]